jgi:hypothetical protein
MQRPKGNDVRRASFDGPAALAPYFRNGRLETIPASRAKRIAVLTHIAQRFAPGRPYAEAEVNRMLQAVNADHATLRRFLVDERLMHREHNVYRRA